MFSKILIYKTHQYALKYNITDLPDERKEHSKPKVRLGGISIFFNYIFLIILLSFIFGLNFNSFISNSLLITIVIVSICFFLIGLTDDIYSLNPIVRLSLQIPLSIYCWSNGLAIKILDLSFLNLDLKNIIIPDLISILITVVWLIGITNAINWIDGLDGLATGTVILAMLSFLIICFSNFKIELIIITLSTLISAIVFLPYNIFPSKILMGDGGSYLFGFNTAAISIISTPSNNFVEGFSLNNMYLPGLILFLPIADMTIVILSRMMSSNSPFYPDRRHFHYKLIDKGFSHSNTVIICCLITFLFSLFSIILFNL